MSGIARRVVELVRLHQSAPWAFNVEGLMRELKSAEQDLDAAIDARIEAILDKREKEGRG